MALHDLLHARDALLRRGGLLRARQALLRDGGAGPWFHLGRGRALRRIGYDAGSHVGEGQGGRSRDRTLVAVMSGATEARRKKKSTRARPARSGFGHSSADAQPEDSAFEF